MSGRWVPAGARDDKPEATEPARPDWRAPLEAFKSDAASADPSGEAAGDAARGPEQGAEE